MSLLPALQTPRGCTCRFGGENGGHTPPKFSPLTPPLLNAEGEQVYNLRLDVAHLAPHPIGLHQNLSFPLQSLSFGLVFVVQTPILGYKLLT